MEEHVDQRGLHAVSVSFRWMNTCPVTGFTKSKKCVGQWSKWQLRTRLHVSRGEGQTIRRKPETTNATAAGGKKIANEGEKDITTVTGSYNVVPTNWQTVDITRLLSSVRQICLEGNRVLFDAEGGVINNIESGQETPFTIENNVCVSWTGGYHRAPRGVFDGRAELLVC